jgi:hypothetical protein
MRSCSIVLLLLFAASIHGHELFTSEQMRTGINAIIDKSYACNDTNVVILVKTAVTSAGSRTTIRETWAKLAKEKYDIPVLFVIGRSKDPDYHIVMIEDQEFGDILMGNFTDSYHNLTLKTIFTMNWFYEHCPQNSFLVYVDDDMAVNPANVILFLNRDPETGINGNLRQNDPVVRDAAYKWFVPHDVYPDKYYPDYCYGAGVIVDWVTTGLLVNGSLDEDIKPKIWNDDAFVYGIVRKGMRIPVRDVPSIRVYGFNGKTDNLTQVYEKMIIVGSMDTSMFRDMWKSIPEAVFDQGMAAVFSETRTKKHPINVFLVVTAFLLISLIAASLFVRAYRSLPGHSDYFLLQA